MLSSSRTEDGLAPPGRVVVSNGAPRARVACFDVSDTVLARCMEPPEATFALVGRRLLEAGIIDTTAEVFARSRVEAGRSAARNLTREIDMLEKIYAELAHLLDWTPSQQANAMAVELEVEAALLRPIPGAADRLEQARLAGQQVVFLSDMYLSAGFVRDQLRQHGLMRDGDLCIVPRELNAENGTDNAFHEVSQRLGVPLNAILHVGNDGAAARTAGVRVVPFYEGYSNRYERILASHVWASGGLSGIMAGASRLARLEMTTAEPPHPAIREVGAGVAGPTLTAYVIWLLRRAVRLGLRRLYFVARDGEILLEIAREVAPRLGIDIDLRYLYGSRQAWHGPALDRVDAASLQWVLEYSGRSSVRSLLALLELKPEQIRTPLEAAGLDEPGWDAELDRAGRTRLGEALCSETGAGMLLGVCRSRREVMLRYLRQEGLLDHDHWAIVDVGWSGRIQRSLSRVLASAGHPPAKGFYFGLMLGEADPAAGDYHAYFFRRTGSRDIGYYKLMWGYFQIMEMFCVGTHGSTLGYREEEGHIAPVLKEQQNSHLEGWGTDTLHASILGFARHLDFEFVDPYGDCRPAIADLLRAFWTEPSEAEAQEWGAFLYEDDQTGAAPLAEPYTLTDVLRGLRHGEIPLHNRSTWWQASMLLAPPPVRWSLRHSVRASRAARRVLQPVRRLLRQRVRSADGTPSSEQAAGSTEPTRGRRVPGTPSE